MPGFSAEANLALISGDRLNESGIPFQAFPLWFVFALSLCLAHSLCPCLHCPICPGWWTPWGDSVVLTLPLLQDKLWCAKCWKQTGAGILSLGHPPAGKCFSGWWAVVSSLMLELRLVYFWLQHGCLPLRMISSSNPKKDLTYHLDLIGKIFFMW